MSWYLTRKLGLGSKSLIVWLRGRQWPLLLSRRELRGVTNHSPRSGGRDKSPYIKE